MGATLTKLTDRETQKEDDKFLKYCFYGNLDKVKIQYAIIKPMYDGKNDKQILLFCKILKKSDLEIIQWAFETFPIVKQEITMKQLATALDKNTSLERLEIAKWIVEHFDITSYITDKGEMALTEDDTEITNAVVQLFVNVAINRPYKSEEDCITVLSWLKTTFPVVVTNTKHTDVMFKALCKQQKKTVIDWFLGLDGMAKRYAYTTKEIVHEWIIHVSETSTLTEAVKYDPIKRKKRVGKIIGSSIGELSNTLTTIVASTLLSNFVSSTTSNDVSQTVGQIVGDTVGETVSGAINITAVVGEAVGGIGESVIGNMVSDEMAMSISNKVSTISNAISDTVVSVIATEPAEKADEK